MEPTRLSSTISSLGWKIETTKDINELFKTLFMYAKLILDTQREYSWGNRADIGTMLYSAFLPAQWRGLIKITVLEVHFPPLYPF